ncbi:TetR family transcriptional regulator [Kosakonia radicincitans DSM 16656]|uniref:Transcriptional regulator, TetR family n=1 Tax=Kosakonia radicincitans TaxID=283686 RepID=A0AAX2EYK6_9ENTR|nr:MULTISPECIES: TetR/AcrR family transcriptional regulator [Kosakonia]MDP9568281.1 AcrR family transcriptional regulator [Kosakonia oryzae]APG18704.1 TetR family transcriptional regulator [Kosakonia radicincitans]ARD60160.1 TetR family transcriptional regulator [Kosakonia radicincitans DSM 16656]KDE33472.1 TetR family transcriptional regulator [Kosakonia radicincitans UMEnt01/12]MDD7993609.1 TetR/AcrR family transcriptional regulator [Kosakonia radicincitans]
MSNVQDEEIGVKSKDRRKQVLDAAAKCFRDLGFHGCSIAKISKEAGMSPGHIYYHFANKEAIVEALVAQQESTIFELINDIATSPADEKLAVTLKRQTARMVELHTSPEFISLWLEIAAEAVRNPNVSQVLQVSHNAISNRFNAQLLKRTKKNDENEIKQLHAKMDIIASIFAGLSQRTALQSIDAEGDKEMLIEMINNVIDLFFKEY